MKKEERTKHSSNPVFGPTTVYRTGGFFALLTVAAIILSIISFVFRPLFPENILQLIYTNRLAGLLSLDILYTVAVVFTLPLIIALFELLKKDDHSISLLALVFGITGTVLLLTARPYSGMLAISESYHAAASDTDKIFLQTLSDITMEQFNGTMYKFHLLFGDISFLLFAILMLRTRSFSRPAAVLGIITNAIAFGMFIPVIGPFIGLFFLLGFIPWLILISLSLFRYRN
ncbi:MAG: DUF4386 family protein [Bacteroidota bacterium]